MIGENINYLLKLKLQPQVEKKWAKSETNTGWKILGKLKGGTNRRRTKQEARSKLYHAEREKTRKLDKMNACNNFKMAYLNINGMSEEKVEEVTDFLETNDLDLLFIRETKKQEGDLMQNYEN